VTQLTDKSTGVTLNKSAGRITMNNAALAGNTAVSFTLTNSIIGSNDAIIVNVSGGGTAAAYTTYISSMTAGSAVVTLRNLTAGSLSEAVILNFAIIHGAV
jgi:threonine dehydratase